MKIETLLEKVKAYCLENCKDTITYSELELLAHSSNPTDEALEVIREMADTHCRVNNEMEKKLLETGVISGNCYVCWHENKFYPGATVDNLMEMGFEKFYETYKSNWIKIQEYRKQFYGRK